MVTIAKTKQPVRMPRFGHRVDKTDPILRGCVGWWPLNDGAGTKVKDLSGNGNDGTQSGGVSWASTEKGTAASFDGVDDYFEVSDTDDLSFTSGGSDSPFSVSAWVYLNSSDGQMFIAKYESLSPWRGEWNLGSSGTKFYLQCVDGAPSTRIRRDTVDSLPLSQWVLVTCVYDGTATDSSIALYVNGAAASSTALGQGGSYVSMDNTKAPFTIGTGVTGYATPYETDGLIQNVRVWDRALTATEVSRLYQDPWAGLEPLSPFSFFSGLSQIYAYYSAAFLQRLG